MTKTDRTLIAGAGAIGQWLGARLGAAGHDVTLLTRAPSKAAIDAEGLHVSGLSDLHVELPCITDIGPDDAGRFDLIIITAKAHATASIAGQVAPALAPDGILASMQNGLGNGQKLLPHVPADRAAVALTSHGIGVEAPGHVRHNGDGTTQVGPVESGADHGARILEALLEDAGLAPSYHDDTRPLIWRKAIVNAAINPLGALYGVPNGGIVDDPDLLALSKALCEEATALARKARVDLDDPWPTVEAVLRATATNRCSMLQDVESRRPTELEQITGKMVRLGELLLVSMPRSESVYGKVKDLERSYLGAEATERLAWDELQHSTSPV